MLQIVVDKSRVLETEVVIIGAGPSGCSASLYLSKLGVDHVLVEKDSFPRDKVCGDALSGKVVSQLKALDPKWIEEIKALGSLYTPSWGVIFSAPDSNQVSIPFRHKPSEAEHSPGYIAKRLDFDSWLFSKIASPYATVLQNSKVEDVEISDEGAWTRGNDFSIASKLVISAEGTRTLLAKKYLSFELEREHHSAGLRAYYEGVSGMDEQGFIELHFVKESLPGYFWIFPLPNGQANVGIGMLSKYVSQKNVNLKRLMQEVIDSPKFKHRFKNARLQSKILGWGLPLGSKKNRPISCNRLMLVGDSASVIDPFTGEGIGNAMFTGKWAAQHAKQAIDLQRYDAAFMKGYDKTVYKKIGQELRVSTIMLKLVNYPRLMSWMIRKIKRNDELRESITFMFDNIDLRKKFTNPMFYLRILFK